MQDFKLSIDSIDLNSQREHGTYSEVIDCIIVVENNSNYELPYITLPYEIELHLDHQALAQYGMLTK